VALNKLPYKRLQQLIGVHLSTKESPSTQQAIDELSSSRKRGYLTKADLLKICRWKSARAIRQIRRNRADRIRRVTGEAFTTRSERKKLSLLTSLYGVGIPMASAILTLTRPARYGVIDIRVWQLLHTMGSVTSNKKGQAFDFDEWCLYLEILRHYAKSYNVGARDIERTLFMVHGRYQRGTLYDNSAR
jgi:hypothetical protein